MNSKSNNLLQQLLLTEKESEHPFVKDLKQHKRYVSKFIDFICTALQRRSKNHDQSKFSDEELPIYSEHFEEFRKTEYGTKEYKEILKKVQPAIDHHYRMNRHHPEYHKEGIKGMNLIDVVEMLYDWRASVMRQDGDIKESIEINQKRFGFSDDLKQIFLNTLEMLG